MLEPMWSAADCYAFMFIQLHVLPLLHSREKECLLQLPELS
jgi:hypothetical protein